MALQQQLVLLQLSLQEQGQLIRESTHQEARLEGQLHQIRMELKVTEGRENELRSLAAELEVGGCREGLGNGAAGHSLTENEVSTMKS